MPQPSRLLSRTAFRPTGLTLPRGNGPTCHFDATTLLPEASRSQSSSFFHTSRPRCFTISPIRIRNPSSRAPPTASTNTSTNVSTAATPRYPNAAILPNISDGFWRVIRSYKFHLILFFGSLGLLAGTKYSLDAGPRSPPLLGSAEDLRLKSKIQAEGNALPIVKQLSADPAWNSWDAYAGISTTPSPTNPQGKSAAQSRITSGPMSGSTGLAFQRVFHNASTGELVNVVYFGPSLASWPGYVHGGALATVLDETLGRCAILKFPSRTGVTANLEMQYRAPTRTGGFYVIRARPMVDETRTLKRRLCSWYPRDTLFDLLKASDDLAIGLRGSSSCCSRPDGILKVLNKLGKDRPLFDYLDAMDMKYPSPTINEGITITHVLLRPGCLSKGIHIYLSRYILYNWKKSSNYS